MPREDYEIRVEGHLDSAWQDWLGGLEIRLESSGETVLYGPIEDQTALHGILTRLRDLNLKLVSVNRRTTESNNFRR